MGIGIVRLTFVVPTPPTGAPVRPPPVLPPPLPVPPGAPRPLPPPVPVPVPPPPGLPARPPPPEPPGDPPVPPPSPTSPAAGSPACLRNVHRVPKWRARFRRTLKQHRSNGCIRRHQPAHIDRINRHVRPVAHIDCRRDFRKLILSHLETRRQQYQRLSTRNRRQILRQAANPQDQIARAKIRRRPAEPAGNIVIRRRTHRNLRPARNRFQPFDIAGEVLRNLQRTSVIHNRYQPVCAGVRVDETHRGFPRHRLIAEAQARVIEKQNQISRLRIQRRRRVGFEGEAFDRLLFVVFPDLEILLLQVADVIAFLVRNHGVHQHHAGFGFQDRIRIRRQRSRLLRQGARRQ